MIIAEFELDHPILRETLQEDPTVEVTWERSDIVDESTIRILIWVVAVDFERFEAAVETDSTVGEVLKSVAFGDRRLYQLELRDRGRETSIYPLLVEEGGMIQDLTTKDGKWKFRVRFPDSGSFSRFWEFCDQHQLASELHRVYEERGDGDENDYGLTELQRETLTTAIEVGYFDIPRGCSLAELGEHLNTSRSATSERLRRGLKSLVSQTVYRTHR